MNQEQFEWNVNYWAEQLYAEIQRIEPISKKLNEVPIPELTYEERYRLRDFLLSVDSVTRLLQRDILMRKETPPTPFYKKLLAKIKM